MRSLLCTSLVLLSACGPAPSKSSTGLALPKGAVHLNFDPDTATLCPECTPDGTPAHVLVAKVTAASLAEADGVVYASFTFDRWVMGLFCSDYGCMSQWQTKPASACYEVKGTTVTKSSSANCPAPASTPTAPHFDPLATGLRPVSTLLGPASLAFSTGEGTLKAPTEVPLDASHTVVDLSAKGLARFDLGGTVDPATQEVVPLVGLFDATGPTQLLPAPDGQPMAPRVRSTVDGATTHRYWVDRPGTVAELTFDEHRLLARPVRGPIAGIESDTAAVLETKDHVVTLVVVPSDRSITGLSSGPVFELAVLVSPSLGQAAAPLRPFAPLWATTPTAFSLVACFDQALEPAALSLDGFSVSDGVTLGRPELLPQGQCVAFTTTAQPRDVHPRLTVTGVRAASGDVLSGAWTLTVPPNDGLAGAADLQLAASGYRPAPAAPPPDLALYPLKSGHTLAVSSTDAWKLLGDGRTRVSLFPLGGFTPVVGLPRRVAPEPDRGGVWLAATTSATGIVAWVDDVADQVWTEAGEPTLDLKQGTVVPLGDGTALVPKKGGGLARLQPGQPLQPYLGADSAFAVVGPVLGTGHVVVTQGSTWERHDAAGAVVATVPKPANGLGVARFFESKGTLYACSGDLWRVDGSGWTDLGPCGDVVRGVDGTWQAARRADTGGVQPALLRFDGATVTPLRVADPVWGAAVGTVSSAVAVGDFVYAWVAPSFGAGNYGPPNALRQLTRARWDALVAEVTP